MFLIQSVIRNHKVKIQSVLKSQTVKMTIINQIAKYHKVSHIIFDMDGLLLGKLNEICIKSGCYVMIR
jgi:hypothetical protein